MARREGWPAAARSWPRAATNPAISSSVPQSAPVCSLQGTTWLPLTENCGRDIRTPGKLRGESRNRDGRLLSATGSRSIETQATPVATPVNRFAKARDFVRHGDVRLGDPCIGPLARGTGPSGFEVSAPSLTRRSGDFLDSFCNRGRTGRQLCQRERGWV